MGLVNKEEVKRLIRANSMRLGEGVLQVLNKEVERLLLKAAERGKHNGRTTLMLQDL